MSERYARVFSLPKNLYQNGAPVVISAGALLKDTTTGKMLAQIKFQNIVQNEIKSVKVKLLLSDIAGRPLEETVTYSYLDLFVKPNVSFGEKHPIVLPGVDARAYQVIVSEVVFEDNAIWTGEDAAWEQSIVFTPIEEQLENPALVQQYKICLQAKAEVKYVPQVQGDIWVCTCGQINKMHQESCAQCGMHLAEAQEWLDAEKLRVPMEERIAKEKAEAEARAEAERKEKERQAQEHEETMKKISKIAVPIVCVIAVLFFVLTNIVIPNGKYNDAVALMEAGQYEEAIPLLSAIYGYQDSAQLMRKALSESNIAISAGSYHTVGVKADGRVVAVGWNKDVLDRYVGQFDVSGWNDIVAVSAGYNHTVGLKANGRVVAVGSNYIFGGEFYGQCNVSGRKMW